MNPSSRRNPSSQRSPARFLPAVAAAAVVGAVVIAGVAGGLGGDNGRQTEPSVTNASLAPSSTIGLPPSTQAIVVESTEAPLVTTHLDQPIAYGSAGDSVRDVQERLTELGFFVGPIDGQFGNLTKMATWAFEKLVMQVPRDEATGVVTDEMWQLMQQPMRVDPRRWHSEGQTTKNHIEIYLPEQVVVFFEDDEAVLISHMSSGTGQEWREEVTIDVGEYGNENGTEPIVRGEIGVSVTPGGIFDVDRMIDGVRQSALGGMWDPAYFNYGIAIHGAMNVPLEPASHGCIRVPLKVGEIFHDYIGIGDSVFVWDGIKEPEVYAGLPNTAYPRGKCRSSIGSTPTTARRRHRPRRCRRRRRPRRCRRPSLPRRHHLRRPSRRRPRRLPPPPPRRRPRRRRPPPRCPRS